MNAILYARCSTDKQRKESPEDQLALLRKRAAAEGWNVVAEHTDFGISGGTTRRPGYQQLLRDLRGKRANVVLAEDTSRLWRNMSEQAPRLAEWKDLGVRLLTLSGIDSEAQGFVILAPVMGAMAELARTEASYRTRRGQQAAAERGKSTGGRAYGYRAVPLEDGSAVYEIVPAQAAVVRRIFEAYAAGDSPRRIASQLHEDSVPSPGAAWARSSRRQDGKWLASAIHGEPEKGTGILNNRKYVGRFVWGRTKWTRSAQDSSQRKVTHLARADVETVNESLRIVPDELWARCQSRRRATRQRYKATGPRSTMKTPFSGLLRCADCGASFVIVSAGMFGCASRRDGGPAACGNAKRVRRDVVEARLVAALRDDLLTDETWVGVERAYRRLAADRAAARRPQESVQERRRKELEAEVGALVEAVAGGGLRGSPAIAARLAAAESELAALAPAPRASGKVVAFPKDAHATYRRIVRDLERHLAANPDRARAVLARLFGAIRIERTKEGLSAVLEMQPDALIQLVTGVGASVGFEGGSGGRI